MTSKEYRKIIFRLEEENKFLKDVISKTKNVPEDNVNECLEWFIDDYLDDLFERMNELIENNKN